MWCGMMLPEIFHVRTLNNPNNTPRPTCPPASCLVFLSINTKTSFLLYLSNHIMHVLSCYMYKLFFNSVGCDNDMCFCFTCCSALDLEKPSPYIGDWEMIRHLAYFLGGFYALWELNRTFGISSREKIIAVTRTNHHDKNNNKKQYFYLSLFYHILVSLDVIHYVIIVLLPPHHHVLITI